MRRGPTIAVLCAATALAACGGGDGDGKDKTQTPAAATQGGCQRVAQPAPEERSGKKPRSPLDRAKDYVLRVETSCGTFKIDLDTKRAPHAAASLVSLSKSDFFDGTTFHRIVPGFVIQGGDPTASGQGGPGYSTVDKPPSDATYTKGVVAMAKTPTEPAGTASSQFFVVVGADAGLPPDYAVVGRVTEGMDVVERIGRQGGPDEQPLQPVVIKNTVVEELSVKVGP